MYEDGSIIPYPSIIMTEFPRNIVNLCALSVTITIVKPPYKVWKLNGFIDVPALYEKINQNFSENSLIYRIFCMLRIFKSVFFYYDSLFLQYILKP